MSQRSSNATPPLNLVGTSVVSVGKAPVDWVMPASADVSQKEQMDCHAFIAIQWVVRYGFY